MRRRIVLVISIFLGIGILSLLSNFFFQRSICLFHNIFGIPCPTCGMTRAYLHLFHGDFKMALYYHPLFFLVPILLWSFLYSRRLFYLCATIFFLFWIYRMFLYFPYREPLVFNETALYPRIVHFFFGK